MSTRSCKSGVSELKTAKLLFYIGQNKDYQASWLWRHDWPIYTENTVQLEKCNLHKHLGKNV